MNADTITQRKVDAASATLAWLNAAIASGQDDTRPALYRTLSVEFFESGVQFVGCDGTMLIRTWAPYSDRGDFDAPVPGWRERPIDSVVVSDVDKFAAGFMRTLASALSDDFPVDLLMSIDPIEDEDEPPLGDEVAAFALTLHALGQRLTCPLYEGQYPDWRSLDLGVASGERVDGMALSTRLFAAVGKLKGINGVDLTFRAEDKAIDFVGIYGVAPVSGVLMPMKRPEPPKPSPAADAGQIEH
jgi:hypothetical protein